MNVQRFILKCLTDRPAAWRSAKLTAREVYGRYYWKLNPKKPLLHRLAEGGFLLLEPRHSFSHCFYPGVDQYEPEVRGALHLLLKAGDTFIDCGANVGYFSVLAAQRVGTSGQVISIEANPITYTLLERNLNANGCGIPVHCALTSQGGEVEIFMPSEGDVYSSLRKGGLVKGDHIQSFKVQGLSLDQVIQNLNLDKVDVVKIDIEGGELDVLNSAPSLLSKLRPMLVVEYGTNTWPSFGATPEGLKQLMHQSNYQIYAFDLKSKQLTPTSEAVWQAPYTNLVLIPNERLPQFA